MVVRRRAKAALAKRSLLLAVLSQLARAPLARAADGLGVAAGGAWWYPAIGGHVAVTRGGRPGSASRVDVKRDLGLGRSSAAEGDITATLGPHAIGLAYDAIGFDGRATTARGFVFHGTAYPAGERTDSSIDLDRWVARYDFLWIDAAALALRAGPRAWIWSFDSSVRATGGGPIAEHRRFTHVLPGLGAGADQTFGAAFLEERLGAGLLGSDRYEIDAEGGAGVALGAHAEIAAGYRWSRLRFHETTNTGDLTMSGPALRIGLRF